MTLRRLTALTFAVSFCGVALFAGGYCPNEAYPTVRWTAAHR